MTSRRVQPDDIIKMNELYLTIGTYAGVGRATGWSGSTVKRYIIPDYKPKNQQEKIQQIEFDIPNIESLRYPADWGAFLQLSEEEKEGVKKLQETLLI